MTKPMNPAATYELDKEKQIVRDAAATDQGMALIKLMRRRYGYPTRSGNPFEAYTQLGAFHVVSWLNENLEDDAG